MMAQSWWTRLLAPFHMPANVYRLWCMQSVIYVLWLALNLLWQVPGAFILNAVLGIYLFFVFPHMFLQQQEEEAEAESEAEAEQRSCMSSSSSSGIPADSETALEVTARHLERMRAALEQVDQTLGVLYKEHKTQFDGLSTDVSFLVSDTRRRAKRRGREDTKQRTTTPTAALATKAREEEEEEGEDNNNTSLSYPFVVSCVEFSSVGYQETGSPSHHGGE